ncbi:MAG: RagB/SusD domain protein [Sphingobacteriaceae bacterium]|jgi:hypothetical protein|nr:RagB/SusD domain protein [Sphingobacteriaceae bacterium]
MKNLYKYCSVVLCLTFLGFSSCKKDLEKSPLDEFDRGDFWTTEANANLALTAVYRGNLDGNGASQSPTSWWSYQALVFLEGATDNAYHGQGDNTSIHKLTNGTLNASVGILGLFWTPSYRIIALSNDFLENIGKVSMDDAKKKRMIAEVRFLRASQYFYLSQHFGSVPLVTKVLTPEEANTVDKASKQVVVDFVLSEYQAAIPDLPRFRDIKPSEIGRASKQAALAFLGRIQLAQKLYVDAATTYKTIIDFNDNQIDPNYVSIFLESNENSSENIFSTQFLKDVFANVIHQHIAPRTVGGFTLINPLANLMEAYQFTDGTTFSYTDPRYDYTDLGKNRDPRLRYTIYYNGSPYRDFRIYTHPDSSKSTDRITNLNSKTGYLVKKYIDEGFTGSFTTGYGGNVPIIRYAEVLLSYLEAKLEAGQPIDQALLNQTINKVRGRASVNMPPITQTNPTLLRPILRNERRVELAMEGIRLWDLLRWGIADQALKGDFYGHPFPVSKTAIKKKSAATPADPFKRWYVTTRNFRKGVDEYWPIPQSEVNINPKLGQ